MRVPCPRAPPAAVPRPCRALPDPVSSAGRRRKGSPGGCHVPARARPCREGCTGCQPLHGTSGRACQGAVGHSQGYARTLHASAPVPPSPAPALRRARASATHHEPAGRQKRCSERRSTTPLAWGRAAPREQDLRLARHPLGPFEQSGAQHHPGLLGAAEPCEALGAGGHMPRCGCRGAGCPRLQWGCIASPQPLDVTCNMDCAWPAPHGSSHGSCPGLGCGSDGGCQQQCHGVGRQPWHRCGMEKGSCAS